jgi:hypothetical protein
MPTLKVTVGERDRLDERTRRRIEAAQEGVNIDGDELDIAPVENIEYGLVSEWVNGLDSLQSAMSGPEVVEEDED